jgi:hypothetical protein
MCALPAMTGAIGWALQKDGFGSPADATAWYWHKAREANIQPVNMEGVFDPEIGGSLLPSGAFRAGTWVAGDIDVYPRLAGAICFPLLGFAGSYKKTGVAAPFLYEFPTDGIDAGFPNKWLSFRRIIPALPNPYGETFQDCRVTSLAITVMPGNPITMRMGILGISSEPTDNPSGVGWSPTGETPDNGGYEHYTWVPIATKVAAGPTWPVGLEKPRELQINLQLGTQDPRREMIVGSYHPDDLTPLSRSISIVTTVNWKNKSLYDSMQYKPDGQFNPVPFEAALAVFFQTPAKVIDVNPDPDVEAELGFSASAITWAATPIGLRGGDTVVMRLNGTVIDAATSHDWKLIVKNGFPAVGQSDLAGLVNGADVTAPTLAVGGSAPEVGTVDASTLVLTFSEAITSLNTQYAAGWSLTVDGAPVGLTYISHPTPTTLRLGLVAPVTNGDVLLVSYDKAIGNITDLSLNELDDINATAVTNNVAA